MQRIALTDGSNSWFDLDRADGYRESTHWDGNNHISDATGSQWDHEVLYRTATGRYVLHYWSQYQGHPEGYRAVEDQAAYDWLVRCGHEDDVPQEDLAAREAGAGETPRRTIRIDDNLWQQAQDRARAEGVDASKLIVRLLGEYLGATRA